MAFRDRLKAQIKRAGLTQQQFAEAVTDVSGGAVGSSFESLKKFLGGRQGAPRLEVAQAMADVLGVRLEWLRDGSGERTHAEQLERDLAQSLVYNERAMSGELPEAVPAWLRQSYAIAHSPGWLALWTEMSALFKAVEAMRRMTAGLGEPEGHDPVPAEVLAVALTPLVYQRGDVDPTDPAVQRWVLQQLSLMLNVPDTKQSPDLPDQEDEPNA